MLERVWQRYPIVFRRQTAFGIGAVIALTLGILSIPSFPNWMGFNGKSLWDLLELLVVPFSLVIVGVWFSRTEKAQELKLAEEAREREQLLAENARNEERRLALDDQREKALQEYMDRMTELLLDKRLRESIEGEEVRAVAYARTHAVLRRLDPQRITSIVRFLLDAKLVGGQTPIISLKGAYLQGVDLRSLDINQTDLEGANLENANLALTKLKRANLSKANMKGAILRSAQLMKANLEKADLTGARLEFSNLWGANLVEVNFKEAKIFRTDLSDTDLANATLIKAEVRDSIFEGADLTNTILPKGFVPPADTIGIPKQVDEQVE